MQEIVHAVKKILGTEPRALVLGIDGRGGSGKSTLARLLADNLPGATVVEIDDFYFPSSSRPSGSQVPGSKFDLPRLADQVLLPARHGAIRYQRYDWDIDSLAEWIDAKIDRILIVEGVYCTSDDIYKHYDLRIWVETDYDTRLARGVARDGESMRSTWTDVWMPAEDRYVELQNPRERADIVVSGEDSQTPFHVISTREESSR